MHHLESQIEIFRLYAEGIEERSLVWVLCEKWTRLFPNLVTDVQGTEQSHEPQGCTLTLVIQPAVLDIPEEGGADDQEVGKKGEGSDLGPFP